MDQGNGLISISTFGIIIIALNLPYRIGSVTGNQFCQVNYVEWKKAVKITKLLMYKITGFRYNRVVIWA